MLSHKWTHLAQLVVLLELCNRVVISWNMANMHFTTTLEKYLLIVFAPTGHLSMDQYQLQYELQPYTGNCSEGEEIQS